MSDAPIGSPNKQLPPLLTRRGSTEKVNPNSKKSSNEDLTNLESLLESQKDSDTKKQLPDFCSCWCNGMWWYTKGQKIKKSSGKKKTREIKKKKFREVAFWQFKTFSIIQKLIFGHF